METPATTPMPAVGNEVQHCPDCGASLIADQCYCLSCGRRRAAMRLPFLDMVAADAQAAHGGDAPAPIGARAERSPLVALTSLIALLLALGIGVLIGRGTSDPDTVAKAPTVNVTGAGAGAGAATPTAAITSDWPAGTSGFTVSLQTLPATATAADVAKAKTDATTAGATDVGALNGAEYPTVGDPGIVVYSGVFDARKQATAALRKLRAKFPAAKVVEVGDSTGASTTSGADGGAVEKDPTAKPIPKSENLSPEEFQKRSKKLPDKLQSEGKPPPTDKKAPGGGSDATTIG